MLFRQLFEPVSCTYTYVIADDYGTEAVIIDPVLEQMPLYTQLLQEWDLKLVYSVDTHTHADHITASGCLREATQCAIALGDRAVATCVDIRLKDGDTLKVGKQTLKALYTPGHTDDHFSYLLDDKVFTGDCLLIRATGRTDFQNGDPHVHYDSLFNKILRLPEQTYVYPAHDYKGMMVSTIGEEKRLNPRLQVTTEAQYVEMMNNLNLPKPKLIDIAVPANQRCGLINSNGAGRMCDDDLPSSQQG